MSRSLTASWVRHSCSGRGRRDRSGRRRDGERGGSACCWPPATGWWTETSSCCRRLSRAQSSPAQTWNVPTPRSAGWADLAWCGSCSTCSYIYTPSTVTLQLTKHLFLFNWPLSLGPQKKTSEDHWIRSFTSRLTVSKHWRQPAKIITKQTKISCQQ